MNTVLLKALLPFIVAFFWVLSIFLFFRGHQEPGGGFIGALCFGLGLLAFSFSVERPSMIFRKAKPFARMAVLLGLLCFIYALVAPQLFGGQALSALWSSVSFPVAGKLSSVLVFDLGVYLVVCAAIVFIFDQVFTGASSD